MSIKQIMAIGIFAFVGYNVGNIFFHSIWFILLGIAIGAAVGAGITMGQ